MTTATMEQKLEQLRLENERNRLNIIDNALQGLLIIAGIGIGAVLVGYVAVQWADTELVDALQECGVVYVEQPGPNEPPVSNKSVDECRAKVFEHFKGMKP